MRDRAPGGHTGWASRTLSGRPFRLAYEMPRSRHDLLHFMHARGATRLERVSLRRNHRTLWSLTGGGRRLNLHVAYAEAPGWVLEALAVVCAGRGHRSTAVEAAIRRVGEWDGARAAAARLRERRHREAVDGVGAPRGCSATPAQRVHLRRLYRYLNLTRFDGLLPDTIPIRVSRRFRTRLGQMRPGGAGGRRVVLEIALHADLFLRENDADLVETLVHEMAHAADYLVDGHVGHGPTWRRWARRGGCTPRATCAGGIVRRGRGEDPTRRVPSLPPGWRRAARRDPPGGHPSTSSAGRSSADSTAVRNSCIENGLGMKGRGGSPGGRPNSRVVYPDMKRTR